MSLKYFLAVLLGCLCQMGSIQAEERSLIDKTTASVRKGADATVRGIERGAKAAGHGIEVGLNATVKGVKRGAVATSDALSKVGNKIVGTSGTESHASGTAANSNGQKPSSSPSQSKAD